MSYSELDVRSNQLAHALIDGGLSRHGRVGIFMHKQLELGVAIYGTLKAGGIFVPLDPFMPVDRLAFIIEDCGIEHLVSADDMARPLRELVARIPPRIYGVSVDLPVPSVDWDTIYTCAVCPPEVRLIDQELGYIMYTSGSTGQPKGMMHTHHGSVSYARWGALHVGLEATDRVASHAPLHFDLSIFDFFSTAQVGATVVLVPEPVTKLPASWTSYMESERIGVVFTVPFTLIEMQQRGVLESRDLSSLRWILFGGEPYPPKHLRALMAELPHVRFTNVYGPAEAPSCICYDVPPLAEDDDAPIPIGVASLNTEGIILDDEDEECAIGQPGELCIRSSTLTRGYWNRPDLNANAFFLRESFGPFPHIYYRTGDVVVCRDDGLMDFLGRKDRMVKTRGHRVELDEVEAAIASHPSILETAAYAIADAHGSSEIHASVTLKEGHTATAAALLQHAGSKFSAMPFHVRLRS